MKYVPWHLPQKLADEMDVKITVVGSVMQCCLVDKHDILSGM